VPSTLCTRVDCAAALSSLEDVFFPKYGCHSSNCKSHDGSLTFSVILSIVNCALHSRSFPQVRAHTTHHIINNCQLRTSFKELSSG
jgi:hypothetical protein